MTDPLPEHTVSKHSLMQIQSHNRQAKEILQQRLKATFREKAARPEKKRSQSFYQVKEAVSYYNSMRVS